MTREERPDERLALVLGVGGSLGAAEVGFIRRIAELSFTVDMVIGTSVGALDAGYVVFHEDPGDDRLREIWRELDGKPLFHRSIPRIALNLLRTRMSLYDDSFVRRLVSAHLPEGDFRAARIPLFITAANLRTGMRHIFSEGFVLDAVLASTAFPGLLPPVRIGDNLFVDGAVPTPTDIDAAIELGATQIIAIDLSPGLDERMPSNIMEVILRSYAVLAEFRSTCVVEHAEHRADVVHIRPGLKTESSSNLGDVDWLIEHSYSMACSVFDQCWDGGQLHAGSYQLAVRRAG